MSGMAIDKAPQLGEYDTVTREEFRRFRGNGDGDRPKGRLCAECLTPLTPEQVKRGGKFCSQRCSGTHNARIGNAVPSPGADGGGTRSERDRMPAGAGPELADRVAPRHGHTRLSAPGEHIETPMSRPEGWDHPAPTATPGETTVASAGAAPAAEKRVPETAGASEGEPPLRAADSPVGHPDDDGCIHIAAALVDVLLAIPGTRSVEMWVGPIGPIEVRR